MEKTTNYYYSAAVLCLSFVAFKILRRWIKHNSHPPPPSPLALPVIGHLHLVKPPHHLSLQTLLSKHGPILNLKFGRRRTLVLSSPTAVEECLVKDDVVFANRPTNMATDCLSYDYTVYAYAPYGHLWRTLRLLTVSEIFSPKTLLRSATVREEEVRSLLRRLAESDSSAAAAVDLKFLLSLLMANVMVRLAVGRPLVEEEEVGTAEEKRKLRELKEKLFPGMAPNVCDYVPILRAVGYGGIEKAKRKWGKERDEYLRSMVEGAAEMRRRRRRRREEDGSEMEEMRSVAEILLTVRELDPEFYTANVVNGIFFF